MAYEVEACGIRIQRRCGCGTQVELSVGGPLEEVAGGGEVVGGQFLGGGRRPGVGEGEEDHHRVEGPDRARVGVVPGVEALRVVSRRALQRAGTRVRGGDRGAGDQGRGGQGGERGEGRDRRSAGGASPLHRVAADAAQSTSGWGMRDTPPRLWGFVVLRPVYLARTGERARHPGSVTERHDVIAGGQKHVPETSRNDLPATPGCRRTGGSGGQGWLAPRGCLYDRHTFLRGPGCEAVRHPDCDDPGATLPDPGTTALRERAVSGTSEGPMTAADAAPDSTRRAVTESSAAVAAPPHAPAPDSVRTGPDARVHEALGVEPPPRRRPRPRPTARPSSPPRSPWPSWTARAWSSPPTPRSA